MGICNSSWPSHIHLLFDCIDVFSCVRVLHYLWLPVLFRSYHLLKIGQHPWCFILFIPSNCLSSSKVSVCGLPALLAVLKHYNVYESLRLSLCYYYGHASIQPVSVVEESTVASSSVASAPSTTTTTGTDTSHSTPFCCLQSSETAANPACVYK